MSESERIDAAYTAGFEAGYAKRAELDREAVDLLREARFYIDARATGSVKAAELLDRIDAALPPAGGSKP